MLCYEAMGDTLEKEKLEEKIINLVNNDPRAQQLYFKYHDLLPKIKITLDPSNEILNRNANSIESDGFLSEDALGEDFLSSQLKVKTDNSNSIPDESVQDLPKRPRSPHQAPV